MKCASRHVRVDIYLPLMSRSAPAALPAALPNRPAVTVPASPLKRYPIRSATNTHVVPASAQHHAMLLSDRTAGLTAPVSHLKNSEIELRTIA